MTRPADYRAGREKNKIANLRPGAAYEFTLADETTQPILVGNLPCAFAISSDRDVFVGYTAAGVSGANRFRVVAEVHPLRREVSAPALYVRNESGDTATVWVDFELGPDPIPAAWGEFTSANGFDGGDSSVALQEQTL